MKHFPLYCKLLQNSHLKNICTAVILLFNANKPKPSIPQKKMNKKYSFIL